MRINFFIPGIYFGGAEKQLLYLVNELRYYRCEVRVVTFYRKGYPELLDSLNVKLDILEFTGFRSLNTWKSFFSFIVDLNKDDVVVSFLPVADFMTGVARVFFKFRWFVFERNSRYETSIFNRIRSLLVCQLSLGLFANSEAGRQYWSLQGRSSILLRNNYDITWQNVLETLDADIRDIDFIYIGRIENPQKNIDAVLEFFEEKVEKGLKCVVIGKLQDERYETRLREGLVEYVEFTEDVFQYLKRSKQFVSLSRYEGSPNTVVEAAFCGCALVLSKIPEHVSLGLPNVFYFDSDRINDQNEISSVSSNDIKIWHQKYRDKRKSELQIFINELYNRY